MEDESASLSTLLERLGLSIDEGHISGMRQDYYWRGADVRIMDDPEFVHRPRHWLDHDVVIQTPHAKELSWLFCQLRDAFSNRLDFRNKFGFYESLAQSALRHLETSGGSETDFRPLLRAVLGTANDFCTAMAEGSKIPPSSSIVVHSCDRWNEQLRFDL